MVASYQKPTFQKEMPEEPVSLSGLISQRFPGSSELRESDERKGGDREEKIREIRAEGRDIKLFWLKTHISTPGNERADQLAKATDLCFESPPTYNKILLPYVEKKDSRQASSLQSTLGDAGPGEMISSCNISIDAIVVSLETEGVVDRLRCIKASEVHEKGRERIIYCPDVHDETCLPDRTLDSLPESNITLRPLQRRIRSHNNDIHQSPSSLMCQHFESVMHLLNSKHIDVRFNLIREKIAVKQIMVQYKCTGDMVAGILTRGLHRPKYKDFTSSMGLILKRRRPGEDGGFFHEFHDLKVARLMLMAVKSK
ncbi:hypothetical protein EVAR_46243_1 [Eumeta japonica]|uniref:Uncharacterized protein n=1 Tax=Eumeta variegata TaxID=151549 RepID=A0A4C1XQN0_EUMVA|nr:hypothetical protein EVAR_46243_1 [Eumeta japonica]